MISLLTPSRKRVDLLRASIESLGKGDWELLVAIDEDDDVEAYEELLRPNVYIYVQPRHGYANLHHYYNFLAAQAEGEYLMLWNDDTIMETKDWVEKIEAHDPTIPMVLNPWNEIDNLFPVITRAWYEAVGHFARNTHADSWVQQVADIDGRSLFVPGISIKHYGEELNDETHTQVREIVRQTSESYRRMGEQRMEDAIKISNYIRKKEHATNN